VELELKEGSEETLLSLGEILRQMYFLTPEPKSKFQRARELSLITTPQIAISRADAAERKGSL